MSLSIAEGNGNIAEGNGKRSLKDRARFLDVARDSALECAAIPDVLVTTKGGKVQDAAAIKVLLIRMVMTFDDVAELGAGYRAEHEHEHEHRCAEHEHEHGSQAEETSEP